MLSIIGFLIILGPLVVVHELGHFWFARLFNVKAEVFSVGFGPKLWSRKRGETEWRVAAIPLGGYVKLLGEDQEAPLSEEDQKRALHRQKAWKRFFIFFGGPLFNFLFAGLVFSLIILIGEPQLASVAGRVVQGSAAHKAGFQSGDKIISIDGKPVTRFDEVMLTINESPNKEQVFQVTNDRGPSPREVKIIPTPQEGFSVYGEKTHVGEIDGLLPYPRSTRLGISDPESLAYKTGIRTGDELASINGRPVTNFEDALAIFADLTGAQDGASEIELEIRQQGDKNKLTKFKLPNRRETPEEMWGLFSSELFIDKVVPGSPAEGAGLKSGDRLMGIGDHDISSFFGLKDAVQRSGEKDGKVRIRWEREGKKMEASVVPTATSVRDPVLKKVNQYTVGVVPMLVNAEPATLVEHIYNPFVLVYRGFDRMVKFSARNFVSIAKMFTGEVSVATLGGPIMIGKLAGESLSHGLIAFLTTMAILSIGLGVLNVLPVPVLDGGHLLLLGIETIRGKPLTMRQMEIIQGVGLTLILALMLVVLKNDLTRLPFAN